MYIPLLNALFIFSVFYVLDNLLKNKNKIIEKINISNTIFNIFYSISLIIFTLVYVFIEYKFSVSIYNRIDIVNLIFIILISLSSISFLYKCNFQNSNN